MTCYKFVFCIVCCIVFCTIRFVYSDESTTVTYLEETSIHNIDKEDIQFTETTTVAETETEFTTEIKATELEDEVHKSTTEFSENDGNKSEETKEFETTSETAVRFKETADASTTPETDSQTINIKENEISDEIIVDISTTTLATTTISQQLNATTERTTKKPFYHKTIEQLVKVVESNILGEKILPEIEITTTEISVVNETNSTDPKLDKLSQQIRSIIDHYRNYGEVTVPNADVPDPMDVPDIKRRFGGFPTTFTKMKMYGLSNFTIEHINTDLNKMQVYILVMIKRLVILGNYSINSWLKKASGPFNVTLLNVETEGAAELKRDENGTLQATDSELDMNFKDAVADFKNLGLVGSFLQGVAASAAPVLFEAIKPVVLKEINNKIREDVNGKLRQIGIRLAGSKPPLDAAVEEGRAYIKENGYDPYYIRDYTIKQNVFTINITEFVLEGLSRFDRVGEVVLSMDSGTIQLGAHAAAVNLIGKCKWAVGIGKQFRKQGYTNFTIDHIQVQALVNQSLDLKTKPVLDRLDVNVGKVRIGMRGAGSFDLVVEVIVNTLPDLLRHIFVEAIEIPLKIKIQQILNKIEPEAVLEKSLPELDNLGL